MSTNNTVVITANTGFNKHKLRNFYITNVFQGFTWMLFHFAVVYFFMQILDSLTLVGIFLGLANLVSFFLDIPLGILQRYISTKKFFIIGAISQLIAVGVFFVLITQSFHLIAEAGTSLGGTIGLEKQARFVFDAIAGNIFTWLSLLVAAFCYGLTKEINEVTTFGYILSNSNPNEYGIILSRSNITFGVGSILGLGISGLLLVEGNNIFALMILGFLLVGFVLFTIKFFDNSTESIGLDEIKEFTVSIKKMNVENVKESLSETIKKPDLQKIVSNTKYLFLKPKQKPETQKIPWGKLPGETKKELKIIWSIISHIPVHYSLIWGLILVLIFGFWDTFASSFLLDFLDDIKKGWGYVLLAIIGIPGIVLQEVAIRLGQKIGDRLIGTIGLILSGISLVAMGMLALQSSPSGTMIISVALVNSLGYACGMAIGQNAFLDLYNRIYAEKEGLKEIDANASAGPMKVIQNFANVFGLMLGGALLAFGFSFFFFVFAIVIFATLFWTMKNKKDINV